MQSILGVAAPTRTDAERIAELTAQRDRARDLCARLEQICHDREVLLWTVLDEPTSHASAAQLGSDIAAHLIDTTFSPRAGL